MRKKITLITNCMMTSLVDALSFLFPNYNIVGNTHIDLEKCSQGLIDNLATSDTALVLRTLSPKVEKIIKNNKLSVTLKKIPFLYFQGFHPDLFFATYGPNNLPTTPTYNSAIVCWAYINGLSEDQAAALFNRKNFKELGYLTLWDSEVARLKRDFDNCALDFYKWYLPVKRKGIFMYTINHPKRFALIEYAKTIASHISEDASIAKQDVFIPDTLWQTVWPVYPEIGTALGVEGSYTFCLYTKKRSIFYTCAEYIHYCYSSYNGLGITPEDLHIKINLDLYSKVLGN